MRTDELDADEVLGALTIRAEKAEAERDAATNRLYAIVNTAGADCIRTYVGTEIADEIIAAERQRIDHYRDKAKKAEAEAAEWKALAQELRNHESRIQGALSDADDSIGSAEHALDAIDLIVNGPALKGGGA